jgi:hypothetical protein
MTFNQKVQNTQEIGDCYCQGLGALRRSDKNKIKAKEPHNFNGSINIDDCLKEKYPNANRWDYAIGYNNKTYFVEVHPAKPGEIRTIERKLEWLKNWKRNTPFREDHNFYWVASKGVGISRRSSYWKQIASLGLKLKEKLVFG